MRPVPETAAAVVVGGGVMGASTLYHLTRAGCTDAVLIERETLASGSTGACAGGCRVQFSDELNVRIGLESIRRFERFQAEIGADIDFKQWGYLFLVEDGDAEAFRRSVELQRSLGAPTTLLGADDIDGVVAGLALDGISLGTFCPLDGYMTPSAVVQGYADAARRAGATVVQGCEALSIDVQGGRVVAVETTAGRIATEMAVCTAGVWSAPLARTAGVELPIASLLRHVFQTAPGDGLRHDLPLVIDFTSGFYFHREGAGSLLFGGREPSLEEVATAAVRRLPRLLELGIQSSWSGYYEESPDHNAIVGVAQTPAGFAYATGFSGHGFQQAPVVGEYLADRLLGRAPVLDLSPFRVERFSDGSGPRPEANVV